MRELTIHRVARTPNKVFDVSILITKLKMGNAKKVGCQKKIQVQIANY
jgi:hypothetical protein